MWKLKHVKKEHVEHCIFVGEEMVVGRKDATLLITTDPSLSRRHAVLRISYSENDVGDPSKKPSLFLRDEKSKYGTFLNGVRVAEEVEVSNGDVIKFGQFDSEYRAKFQSLVVTTSCVSLPSKRELKKIVLSLGGSLVSEWQPCCTHLVMPEVKVTIKALCCLVSAKPIVTPEYFSALVKSLKNTASIPPPSKFIPPIGEPLIEKDQVSFDINLQRKTLFTNKTFFFLEEKQFKKLHLGIMLGGGEASILSGDTVNLDLLLKEGCCVIEPNKDTTVSSDHSSLSSRIATLLSENKLKMIPESEVGLSVAYCSTERFCNPQNSLDSSFRSQRLQSQTLSQREVYVPNTEQSSRSQNVSKNIDETIFGSLNLTSVNPRVQTNSKSVLEEDMEIPLSAQVKRELDDIFSDDDDDLGKRMSIPKDPPPPVLPPPSQERHAKKPKLSLPKKEKTIVQEIQPPVQIETPRNRKIQPAAQIETSRNRKVMEPPATTETLRNRRVKSENVTPPSSKPKKLTNGHSNHNDDDDDVLERDFPDLPEAELPRNLVKISYVDLIRKKPVPVVEKYKNLNVKNFKRFKKVLPTKARALPRIIGAHELIPSSKVASAVPNEFWEDMDEDVPPKPVRGEFDWDTPIV